MSASLSSMLCLLALLLHPPAARGQTEAPVPLASVFELASEDEGRAASAAATLAGQWQHSYAVMLVELLYFAPPRAHSRILGVLEHQTGQPFGADLDRWYEWIWRTDPGSHPEYAEFKAILYAAIDHRFRSYFDDRPKTAIRLDEIRWGGVMRDGIPPLDHPTMLPAAQATYLDDDHVVFGIEWKGDARAYPKRILAWHEMVRDRVGGEELNGVYCTLCGSMIFYRATVNGTLHVLGTSGFLYRSNKLMYDRASESLWSTLTGTPVVGPLVGQGIELEPLFVVTTTWREWRKLHPDTRVLSLDTGHQRDYGEGVAYRDYFASDSLMFTVPRLDHRLPNKAEVLAVRLPGSAREPLAISAEFLRRHPVYQDRIGRVAFVVLTDETGGNRVYASGGHRFVSWTGSTAIDSNKRQWRVSEAALTRSDGTSLRRLPAHRAFWFGWYAAYPDTRLVK
jgi:hypothetical protein